MSRPRRRDDAPRQRRALARTYLARFFDNELTGGSTDLTHSFLWLIAALAMPGVALPNNAFERSGRIAVIRAPEGGPDYLRLVAGVDIVFSLGLTMIGVGLVAAIVWQALLIDRRDVEIIGSFPVRHRTILSGKFLAVAAFFGIISVGMHALGAFFYGLHLGVPIGLAHAARLVAVHFVVSTLAGFFAFGAVIAMQGVLLAAAGPRRFTRWSPSLQLVVIGLVVLLLIAPP